VKDTLGDFRSIIKYTINSIHEFEMTVTAKCVPVVIEVDRSTLKFVYSEASLEMAAKETIRLTNQGNSDAVFKFALGKERQFMPSLVEGRVASKETIQIVITFTPP
jgi:hypothetical protein